MKLNKFLSISLFCLLISGNLMAESPIKQVKKDINSTLTDKKAKVGVAVLTNDRQRILINNNTHYPIMSVFKFPIAMCVMHKLDQNQISLDSILEVKASQLLPNTYSPLRDKYPNQDLTISVGDLIKYSVALSDNNACDILIDYAGGIAEVDRYIKNLGIKNISLSLTEAQMHEKNSNAYINRGTPSAVTDLLKLFYEKELFSPQYKEFLLKTMIETSTGQNKLAGMLPPEAVIGHKTGSSDRDDNGMKIADNDAGFVRLPNGKTYYIAVFVMDSQETDQANASIIARISKIVYDWMNSQH